jgi:hypothetical protein
VIFTQSHPIIIASRKQSKPPMDEGEFWIRLEYRVCREMDGIPEYRRVHIWCDGFIPEEYALDRTPAYIAGLVWIGLGDLQEKWRFKLTSPLSFTSRDSVLWSELLPAEDLTKWLAAYPQEKRLDIQLAAAVRLEV